MFTQLQKCYNELTCDDSSKRSLAKTILFWGFIFASFFMWKLIIMGGMQPEYFIGFLAFVTGHANMSKFLDKRNGNTSSETK